MSISLQLTMLAAVGEEIRFFVPNSQAPCQAFAAVRTADWTWQSKLAELASDESFEVKKAESVMSRDAVVRYRHLGPRCSRLHLMAGRKFIAVLTRN
jgi:hypothetical protein